MARGAACSPDSPGGASFGATRQSFGDVDHYYQQLGENGCRLVEAANLYSYARDHVWLNQTVSWDGMTSQSFSLPLILIWGAIEDANHCMDLCLKNIKILVSDPKFVGGMDTAWAVCHVPMNLFLLGRLDEINPLFESFNLHWTTSRSTFEHWSTLNPWLRGSDPDAVGGYCQTTSLWWQYRCEYSHSQD